MNTEIDNHTPIINSIDQKMDKGIQGMSKINKRLNKYMS